MTVNNNYLLEPFNTVQITSFQIFSNHLARCKCNLSILNNFQTVSIGFVTAVSTSYYNVNYQTTLVGGRAHVVIVVIHYHSKGEIIGTIGSYNPVC